MIQKILVFKNNLPNLTVLQLFSQDTDSVIAKLQQKLKQAPMMFIGMSLLLDISEFDRDSSLSIDILTVIEFLRGEGIQPVGLLSDSATRRTDMMALTGLEALSVLQSKREYSKVKHAREFAISKKTTTQVSPRNTRPKSITSEEPRKTFEGQSGAAAKTSVNNQIIRHPIRSGQRVYAQGDLTIVGTVSPGAEVIADGSIHVYGKLSGRAIAGAQGNERAAIFCQHLDAELVSIAGNYKQLEEIDIAYRQQSIQISLENEKIVFSSL